MRVRLWVAVSGILCLFLVGYTAAAPSTVSRAERIRSEARKILASPEFQHRSLHIPVLEKIAGIIRRALRVLADWLDRLFRAGRNAGGASEAVLWAVFTGLVVLMAFLIAATITRLSGKIRQRRSASAGSAAAFVEHPQDPDVWLARAHSALAAGDLRAAFRAVFLAILMHLDRAGVMRYRDQATNGEYLAALRKRPELYSVIWPVVLEFDAHWYGFRPVSRDEVDRALAAFGRVQTLTAALQEGTEVRGS